MTDIHTHILPGVDDGCKGIKQSLEMLKIEEEQGVTNVILTPHCRGNKLIKSEELKKTFDVLDEAKRKAGLKIKLFLGQEIYYVEEIVDIFDNKEALTVNNTKYILVEFSTVNNTDINENVYELKSLGFVPIIAHIERYPYITVKDVAEIKRVGAKIQVNAETVIDKSDMVLYRKVRKMLKLNLVDFIASDVHYSRTNYMAAARAFIAKKYGEERATQLFGTNAEELLREQR